MNRNLILVDASYATFYRFFATKLWFAHSQKEEYTKYKDDKDYDWINNNIFMKKYEEMYLESIKRLVKVKVFKNSTIIFCRDSMRSTLWRHDLVSTYKKKRPDMAAKHNMSHIFDYTYKNIIPNLIKDDNIHSMHIKRMEGDDIIACICKYMETKNNNIYIVSGDEDFLQLGRPNLFFINFKKKKLVELTKKEAEDILYKKILLGDTSDFIPGILPKGKKKNELLESKELLLKYLDENPDIKKKYILNQKLIDFNNIPKEYVDIVIEKFSVIFTS
jgi:5'-3' exonuclease